MPRIEVFRIEPNALLIGDSRIQFSQSDVACRIVENLDRLVMVRHITGFARPL